MVCNSYSCYVNYNCYQYKLPSCFYLVTVLFHLILTFLPDFLFLSLCLKYSNLPLISKVPKVLSFVCIFGGENIIEFFLYYSMNIMSLIRKFKPFSSADFICMFAIIRMSVSWGCSTNIC